MRPFVQIPLPPEKKKNHFEAQPNLPLKELEMLKRKAVRYCAYN
jgi:hypothetical protein